jgi:GntR family transcriptional regulator/MocR family aminotransferase
MLGYGDPAGYEPLRVAIANYLTSTRAVRATPDQIVVVSGSQQALDLAARVLADVDGRVLVEDPVRTGAWAALRSAGLRLVPVPVDAEGADIRAAGDSDAKLLYVSPSHQFPLGVRMSYRRRLDVLEWSSTTNGWVIEDDYDSEYRYAGQPLPSLQGMDATDSVVYIGTFSRSLFPSLRLGYLVAPRELTSAFVSARAIIDRQPPMLDQIVLAEFIEDGHFQRHLRRMRRIYGRRQEVLIESAQRRLGGVLEIEPDDAGMHVVGYLPDHVSDVQVESEAAALGVEVTALSRFSLAQRLRPGLLFGYAVAREDEIDRGVALLADAISTVAQP